MDDRAGQDAKKKFTVLQLAKVIVEILRKKVTDATELKKFFDKEKWDEIEPSVAESVYL